MKKNIVLHNTNKFYMIRISIFYTMIFLFIGTHQLWGQAPSVQWIEVKDGNTETNYLELISRGNDGVFGVKYQVSNGGNLATYSIIKYDRLGIAWEKPIDSFSFSMSARKPIINIFGAQDGGVLMSYNNPFGNFQLVKYDASGNEQWRQSKTTAYYGMYLVGTPTLALGFHLYDGTSLVRINSTGTIEYSISLGTNTSITDLKTTPDDGVLVVTKSSITKYDSKGKSVWENKSYGGNKVLIADGNFVYLVSDIGVYKINQLDGTRVWAYALNGTTTAQFTEDKGCVVLTGQSSIKLNADGVKVWDNIYGGNSITTTLDNGFVIANGASIVKISSDNKVMWEKPRSSTKVTYNNVFTLPDNGILVLGNLTLNVNSNFGTFATVSSAFKLVDGCITPLNLLLNSNTTQTTFCKTANATYNISLTGKTLNTNSLQVIPTDFKLQWLKDGNEIQGATGVSYMPTSTGNYTVRNSQSNNACSVISSSLSINILSATKPIVTSNRSQICQGAEATLIATGCEGNVAWSTGGAATSNQIVIKPQPNTFYYATCESNFIQNGTQQVCRSETSSNLSFTLVNNNITTSITGDNAVCKGSKTALSSNIQNGVEPFNYSWNTNGASIGQNNKTIDTGTQGDYTVSVIDSRGCSATSSTFKLTEKGGDLSALISPVGSTTVITPETVTLNANTGLGLAYIWQKDNQNIPNATTNTFTAKESGSYTVVVSRDGCSLASAPIIVRINQPLAVEELLIENGVVVAPNPTQDRVAISVTLIKPSKLKVSLFSITGQVIQTLGINEVLANHIFNLDLSQYSTGMYLLHIETEDGGTYRKIQKL
jgi:Secretion system C-terminal sorting domain/PQQ-like domain